MYYSYNNSAWMTSMIFKDWFLNSFLHEIGEIIDPHMPIQFLIDNCSAHNDETLAIQDPNVTIKYLPANTTSLI